jgi:hypothetical protein
VKRALASIAVVLVVFAAVVVAQAATTAPTAPSRTDVRAWLQDQKQAQETDLHHWNRNRRALDEEVRADTRALDREVLIPIIKAPTHATAQSRARRALEVLAAPGPADSASKRLHTKERRITDHAKQSLKRHLSKTTDFLAEFP